MEALAAVGLASNALDFITCAWKIITGAWEIQQSTEGSKAFVSQAEVVQSDLSRICEKLQVSQVQSVASVDDGKALQIIAKECSDLSREFKAVLVQLKATQPHSKWESLKKAFATVWKEKELKEYSDRLHVLRSQLTLALLAMMSNSQSILRNDIALAIHDSQFEVKAKLDALVAELPTLKPYHNDLQRDVAVLDTLRYEAMTARHRRIDEAEAKTFEWVFTRRDQSSNPGPGFLEWLQMGNGFFWIRGKAGSGKSTLMKFLYDDPRTAEALKQWAGHKNLHTANHYFWKAGTDMQRSLEGLLKSLLYDLFRHTPSLIRIYCPQRWQSIVPMLWTRRELLDTLVDLHASRDLAHSSKFCFFIDGLDEYEGDHLELTDVIKQLAPAPHIKICVSSRPWQEFIDAFDATTTPNLRLDLLTAKDMLIYVNASFMKVPRYPQLCAVDNRYAGLVREIVQRAEGVFLWVALVVRAMRRGFIMHDNIDDCWKRLEEIPRDLDAYFRVILNSIEPTYREEGARILQICSAALEPQPVLTLSFFFDPIIQAAFADTQLLRNEKKMVKFCEDGEIRIRARCTDLVEIVEDSPVHGPQHISRHRVEFLHRTVRDYVLSSEVQHVLRERLVVPFEPHSYLTKSYLMLIKLLEFSSGSKQLRKLLTLFMFHARSAEELSQQSESGALDHLEAIGLWDQKYLKDFWVNAGLPASHLGRGWLAAVAVQLGCPLYVSERLDRDPGLHLGVRGQPLLGFALEQPLIVALGLPCSTLDMNVIKMLLQKHRRQSLYGDDQIVWICFLTKLHQELPEATMEQRKEWDYIVCELASHGADTTLFRQKESRPGVPDFSSFLDEVFPPSYPWRIRHLLQGSSTVDD